MHIKGLLVQLLSQMFSSPASPCKPNNDCGCFLFCIVYNSFIDLITLCRRVLLFTLPALLSIGPACCQTALTNFALSDKVPHIAFIDGQQHVNELFYQDGKWQFNDLTASSHAPAARSSGGLTSFVLADKVPHIAFIDGQQHVNELFFQNHKWQFNDLTASSSRK